LRRKVKLHNSTIVLGQNSDASVVDAAALEELGLQVDPVTGELKAMELLLLRRTSPKLRVRR